MLTPQEATSTVFEKAVFGGYDIAAVDKFLNQLSKDYNTLYLENELLKKKNQALVERIEEYRSTEDAMRLALLSAKKEAKEMALQAEAERQALSEELLRQRSATAEESEQSSSLKAELEREEAALRYARTVTGGFLEKFRAAAKACEATLTDLYRETELPEPEPVQAEPAEELPPSGGEAPEAAETESSGGWDFENLNFSRI